MTKIVKREKLSGLSVYNYAFSSGRKDRMDIFAGQKT